MKKKSFLLEDKFLYSIDKFLLIYFIYSTSSILIINFNFLFLFFKGFRDNISFFIYIKHNIGKSFQLICICIFLRLKANIYRNKIFKRSWVQSNLLLYVQIIILYHRVYI